MYIILHFVTCGISSIIWYYSISDDLYNEQTPSGLTSSAGTTLLLSFVTCGIYCFYVFYKWGEQMPEIYAKYGRYCENRGLIYLLLGLFTMGLIPMALVQNDLNQLVEGSAPPAPPYGGGYSGQPYTGQQPYNQPQTGGQPYGAQPTQSPHGEAVPTPSTEPTVPEPESPFDVQTPAPVQNPFPQDVPSAPEPPGAAELPPNSIYGGEK
jgi:hypothetical protein